MRDEAIHEDASDVTHGDDYEGDFDPTQAFLDMDEPAQKSKTSSPRKGHDEDADVDQSDSGEDETGDEDVDTSEEADETETDPEDGDTEDDAQKKTAKRTAEDDDEIVTTVDGKEVRATVKDVRRLLGQEAALTRKSMETAEVRRSADAERTYLAEVMKPLLTQAQARWNEYKDANLYLEAQRMDAETFKVFEADHRAARENLEFVSGETQRLTQLSNVRTQEARRAQVQAAHEAIRTEGHAAHIPGWSAEVYESLRTYGIKELGITQADMDAETNPLVFKLLHLQKAANADKAKAAKVQEKAKAAKPATSTTSRIKVVAPNAASGGSKAADRDTAMSRLSRSGKISDAAKAFEAL